MLVGFIHLFHVYAIITTSFKKNRVKLKLILRIYLHKYLLKMSKYTSCIHYNFSVDIVVCKCFERLVIH